MDCKRGICRQAGHVVVQLAGVAVGRGHCVDGGARGGARGGDRLSSYKYHKKNKRKVNPVNVLISSVRTYSNMVLVLSS